FLAGSTLLLAVALTVAGCTGSSNPNSATTPPPTSAGPAASTTASSPSATPATSAAPIATGTYHDQLMAWGRQFAACVRSHGDPPFPAPVYPAGIGPNGPNDTAPFPAPTWGTSLFDLDKGRLAHALDLCPDLFDRMPPTPDSEHPPT